MIPDEEPFDGIEIGTVIEGRYRIDGVLGKGGMGSVYRAEHLGIGRAVAIKVLHTELGANREAAQRFQREALASGRLDHPNIVAASDFGVLDDGSCYLVMEALEGESLGARLARDGALPWPLAIEIMCGMLRGLEHAHKHGVVHRDIKPDNVFLALKNNETLVKILDFGIAKLFAGDAADPAATRAGITVGTPSYLSPEQAVGGNITPASDLYSASIVLFEMITGRVVFDERDPVAIMVAHIHKTPPLLCELLPGIELPVGLESIVQRGLQKRTADRIQSAAEYLSLLDGSLAGAGLAPSLPSYAGSAIRRDSRPIWVPTPPPMPAMAASATLPHQEVVPHTPSAQRATSIADVTESWPRRWYVVAVAVLVAVVLIAFVASTCTSSTARKADVTSDAGPGPAVLPNPGFMPPAPPTTADKDVLLKAALHDLQNGATCEQRRAAIGKLVEVGDARAIQPLRAARYRMRGGLLGVGQTNTNACLKATAEAAIKALGGSAPPSRR